jgi:heme/copper-type cytochrome/quinol oxidase subunit 2
LHRWDRAHGKGLRFAVAWLSPDGNQAIVQLERFQGAWLLAVGIGWLILGTFAAGFQTFRASLQDHVGNTPVPRNA